MGIFGRGIQMRHSLPCFCPPPSGENAIFFRRKSIPLNTSKGKLNMFLSKWKQPTKKNGMHFGVPCRTPCITPRNLVGMSISGVFLLALRVCWGQSLPRAETTPAGSIATSCLLWTVWDMGEKPAVWGGGSSELVEDPGP